MIHLMEVNYRRDLYHNFMVISGVEHKDREAYCIMMLAYQQIEGILPVEIQTINSQAYYNYKITAKQSLLNLCEKTVLTMDRLRKLFINLIDTIERSYDYLLVPDDFILSPEYIYLDINTDMPFLSYLPGYQKNIKEQMSNFIEYIMNKVDYNNKEAVLLIYHLYAVSKEAGYTFHHLKTSIQNNNYSPNINKEVKEDSSRSKEGLENIDCKPQGNLCYDGDLHSKDLKDIEENRMDEIRDSNRRSNKNCNKKKSSASILKMPVMMEKLVGEQEVNCYPLKTYIFTLLSVFAGVFLLILSIKLKLIYNSFGNRIDYSKLLAVLLILLCLEGYLIKHIWDKKYQITKLVTKCEYLDPRDDLEEKQEMLKQSMPDEECVSFQGECGLSDKNSGDQWINYKGTLEENEEYNPTCLLSEVPKESSYLLVPLDKVQYETILIKEMPFFIGKIKKNVDYCLEKDVVSRYHAKITKEEEQFFLTDLNSTNGTFLNGEALQPYDRKKIKIGDEITLANIKFIFTLG